ncbi:hypothetical protein SprV_0100219600 [Sparganum proliferum]
MMDIVDLGDTLFCEQGRSEDVGTGCTLFWSGRPKAERRDACVDFTIWTTYLLPHGINGFLMTLRLPV